MTGPASTSATPRSQFVRAGGLRLNVLEWGDAQAEPLVLLHGLRGDARTWSRTAERLATRYRLIGIDQRGRGESDWDPARSYFTTSYVADLLAVVDALKLTRFILLGHSMGGSTALMFTASYPERVRALIVEDIGPGSSAASDGADRIRREMASTPVTFASTEAARAFWRDSRPTASPASIEDRLTTMMVEQPDGTLRWRLDMAGIAEARLDPDPTRIPDLWPAVRTLSCPSLMLRGELSDFLSRPTLQAVAAANAHIQTGEIAAASHYVHDDNFPAFIAAVSAFLASLPPERGDAS